MSKPSDFEAFFADTFPRLLDRVEIPARVWATPPAKAGGESWDRRAAWLLYAKREGIYVDLYADDFGEEPAPAPAKKAWDDDDL